MKSKFKIMGLDCANCATELERRIQKIDGIDKIQINFIAQRMEIEYDEAKQDEIMQNVKKVIKKEEPDVTIEKI